MKDFHPYPRKFSILNLRWLMQTCESILVIVDDSLLEFGVPESITRRGLGTAGVRHGAPSRRAAAALFLPRRRRRAKVPRRTALITPFAASPMARAAFVAFSSGERMRELICLLQWVGRSIFSVTGITFERCLPCMGRDACGSSWSVSARTSWDTTRSFMVCPPYEYVYVLQNCCGQRRFFRRYRKCRVSRPCEFSCAY